MGYLGAKTLPKDGWDGWFGSSQVYMGAKYWANDGILTHKLLLLPMGYSKVTKYLDDQDLRHHARGTKTGGLIGNRLYYTHYPNSYILPYAMLMKVGLYERYWHRMITIAFSLIAITLLYVFLLKISSRSVAFFGSLYYGISIAFLNYADTLSNQPLDDLWRFVILTLSVIAADADLRKKTILNLSMWGGILALAISSYDSTFFIFVWLVGFDFVVKKRLLWKRWLFFASAPVFGFVLQMLQNRWYLGNWKDVMLDSFGAGLAKTQTSSILSHMWSVFRTFELATGLNTLWASVFVFALLFLLWNNRKIQGNTKLIFLATILFLAGSAYPFVFVGSGGFPYQGRQMMPFLALIIGLATFYFYNFIICKTWQKFSAPALVLFLSLFILWSSQIHRTAQYVYDWPNNRTDKGLVKLGEELKSIKKGDAVIFDFEDFSKVDDMYPQPDPYFEYYSDTPILSFKKATDLASDYNKLKQRSVSKFDSIIVTDSFEKMAELSRLLPVSINTRIIEGKYVSLIIDQ